MRADVRCTPASQPFRPVKPEIRTARFGNAAVKATVSPATRMFHFFESSYTPGFILLSKIISNVIPRAIFTRNWSERNEVLFNEITQGGMLFVSLPLVSPIADWVQGKFSGVSQKLIRMNNDEAIGKALAEGGEAFANKVKISKLGKSLGASAFIASLLVMTTYWRNYRTIKRTGFSDYKKVVGLGGNAKPTAEDLAQSKIALKKNLNIIQGLIAGGAGAWLAIMAGAGLIARRGQGLFQQGRLLGPKMMDRLMHHWAFVGKHSNQINMLFKSKWQTLVVWGIPSYAGWLLGCRDKYEVIEQMSKFLTFMGGYFATPAAVAAFMKRKDKGLLNKAKEQAFGSTTYTNLISNYLEKAGVSETTRQTARELIRHKNTQWGILTVVNFLVAGALPLVFNIFFSNWRNQREQAEKGLQSPAFGKLLENQHLIRKKFEAWGHRAAR